LMGHGEPKPGSAAAAEKAREQRYERRQRAIDKLVDEDGLTEEQAEDAVELVRDKADWRALYEAALEEFRWRQWKEDRASRTERPRQSTPVDPPSVDAIGKRKTRAKR
jgi:hypothetical protein